MDTENKKDAAEALDVRNGSGLKYPESGSDLDRALRYIHGESRQPSDAGLALRLLRGKRLSPNTAVRHAEDGAKHAP